MAWPSWFCSLISPRTPYDRHLIAVPFLIFALLSPPVVDAAKNFQFSTNPPDKQHDYFDLGRKGRTLIDNVEQNHLVPAMDQLRNRNFRAAHNSLDFVLRWYPNHPRALDLYSQLAVKRDKPESALPYLDYALKFQPDTVSTHIIYGIHRYRMNDYRKAVEHLEAALELEPDSAEAHYNLGLTFLKLKEYPQARTHALEAYELGYPLPGLRNRLRAEGQWNPADS